MRRIFLNWLFLFIICAFVITFFVSFYMQTEQAKNNGANLISLKIEDAKKQIIKNNENLSRIQKDSDRTALSKVKTFSYILKEQPNVVYGAKALENIKALLDVDELNVINHEGIIFASTNPDYIGFDMETGAQSREFNARLLKGDGQAFVQPMQAIAYDTGVVMQYAGASLDDNAGYVQIGYNPARLIEAEKAADIRNLAAGFRIGNMGKIVVCENGLIVSAIDEAWTGKPMADFGIDLAKNKKGVSFDAQVQGTAMLCSTADFEGYTIVGMLPGDEMFVNRNTTAIGLVVFNLLLFALIFILISLLVQKIVINGIYSINHSLGKITAGNLNEVVRIETNEEFIALSDGINCTVASLKNAIAEAAARIDKELEFAKTIQTSSLPCVFPPYPDRREFDIYASMYTAREVGGDFYDFFLVDSDHLGVVIADVSGKGIPAALFMMTAKTLIKTLAEAGKAPMEIFHEANNRLCEGNDAGMFVTAFMGILEIPTGKFTYVNAGHNPPFIKRANKDFSLLPAKPGFVLAGMENIHYEQAEITLYKGDIIFMYTDGVTEAVDINDNLFSETKLLGDINKYKDLSLEEMLISIKGEIDKFAGEAEQADDITMLAVTLN